MIKNDVIQRINAVCKTLDTGITINGVQNAGNLAGCYVILQEVLTLLNKCEITEVKEVESTNKAD